MTERLKNATNTNIDPRNARLFIQKYMLEKPFVVMDIDIISSNGLYMTCWHQSQYEEMLTEMSRYPFQKDTIMYSIPFRLTVTFGPRYKMSWPHFMALLEKVKSSLTEHNTGYIQPRLKLAGAIVIEAWKDELRRLIMQCDSAIEDCYDVHVVAQTSANIPMAPPEMNLIKERVVLSILNLTAESFPKMAESILKNFGQKWPQGCIPRKPRVLKAIRNKLNTFTTLREYTSLRARLQAKERSDKGKYLDGEVRRDALLPLVRRQVQGHEIAVLSKKTGEAYDRLLSKRRTAVVTAAWVISSTTATIALERDTPQP